MPSGSDDALEEYVKGSNYLLCGIGGCVKEFKIYYDGEKTKKIVICTPILELYLEVLM